MAKFAVAVGGANYEVDAPDEGTAWKWANATHLQAIKNDPQRAPKQAVPAGLETATSTIGSEVLPMMNTGNGVNIGEVPYELGAKVNDAAAKYLPAPVAAGLGTAANVGMEGMGMLAGAGIGAAAGTAARPVLEAGGRRVMQSALKPGVRDLTTGKADRAITTMLDEGINVTRGGSQRLRAMGEQLNRDAAAEIAGSTARVDQNAVASRLAGTAQQFRNQVNPQADLAAIAQTQTNFFQHPDLLGRSDMSVQLANRLKQGTQTRLRDSYGELGGAATEAQKTLARSLRQEIEGAVPSVVPINRRAAEIWNALGVQERRAMVAGNNNPLGLTALAGSPASAALFAADRSSLLKSLMARSLHSGGRAAPYLGAGAGMAAAMTDNE